MRFRSSFDLIVGEFQVLVVAIDTRGTSQSLGQSPHLAECGRLLHRSFISVNSRQSEDQGVAERSTT